jgi:hypothetical protein
VDLRVFVAEDFIFAMHARAQRGRYSGYCTTFSRFFHVFDRMYSTKFTEGDEEVADMRRGNVSGAYQKVVASMGRMRKGEDRQKAAQRRKAGCGGCAGAGFGPDARASGRAQGFGRAQGPFLGLFPKTPATPPNGMTRVFGAASKMSAPSK